MKPSVRRLQKVQLCERPPAAARRRRRLRWQRSCAVSPFVLTYSSSWSLCFTLPVGCLSWPNATAFWLLLHCLRDFPRSILDWVRWFPQFRTLAEWVLSEAPWSLLSIFFPLLSQHSTIHEDEAESLNKSRVSLLDKGKEIAFKIQKRNPKVQITLVPKQIIEIKSEEMNWTKMR